MADSKSPSVSVEIGDGGPTFDQIALARAVLRRVTAGPQFIGTEAWDAADRWLDERQTAIAQEHMKTSVAKAVLESTERGVSVLASVLNALSNYELKQV